MLSKKELPERLARWATVVQGENLKIVHKSEKAHSDADTLSRYPVAGGENDVDEVNDNYLPICSIMHIGIRNKRKRPSRPTKGTTRKSYLWQIVSAY